MSGHPVTPTSSVQSTSNSVASQRRSLPIWVWISLLLNGCLILGLIAVGWQRTRGSPSIAATLDPSGAISSYPSQDLAPFADDPNSPPPSTAEQPPLGTRHYYSYQEWLGILTTEANFVADTQPSNVSILAGDSISLWFPKDLLPEGHYWLNQGISGETSAGLWRRLDLFADTQPTTIFVMIGINDLLRGIDPETVLANQQGIIQDLKQQHPRSQIVVQSILPHSGNQSTWEGRDRLATIPNTMIQTLNQQLEVMADVEDVYFLDLYPLFATDQGDLRLNLTTDGLHLNDQGYLVWRSALQLYHAIELDPT